MIGPVSIRPNMVWRVALDNLVPGCALPDLAAVRGEHHLGGQIAARAARRPSSVQGSRLWVPRCRRCCEIRSPIPICSARLPARRWAQSVCCCSARRSLGGLSVSAAAFVRRAHRDVAVYTLAWQDGRFPTGRLVLSGVAVSYLFSSITNLLIFRAPSGEQARTALFWMLGGLGSARWESLGLPGGRRCWSAPCVLDCLSREH